MEEKGTCKFEIGDEVRYIDVKAYDKDPYPGQICTVREIRYSCFSGWTIDVQTGDAEWWYQQESEFELVRKTGGGGWQIP